MKTLKRHLMESLKNSDFKERFDEEKELLEVALGLQEQRLRAGLSQRELAEAAHLTQQQISKVENGANCNIMTYLKVGHAVGMKLGLRRLSRRRAAAG